VSPTTTFVLSLTAADAEQVVYFQSFEGLYMSGPQRSRHRSPPGSRRRGALLMPIPRILVVERNEELADQIRAAVAEFKNPCRDPGLHPGQRTR